MAQKSYNGQMVTYTRMHEADYKFIEEIAKKQCWGKHNQAFRLCIRFARKNQEEFEKFIQRLREEFE